MIYIYMNCCGDLYYCTTMIEDTYCEQCGDFDILIGKAKNKEEAYKLFDGEIDINGSGGWDKEYIDCFINNIKFNKQ